MRGRELSIGLLPKNNIMSLSTLGAQLAAINNGGTTVPSSKRHEDAIGRGLAHSVQIGYNTTETSVKFKPSILHENARQAAQIPLTTLRDNCIEALEELSEVDDSFQECIATLCQGES